MARRPRLAAAAAVIALSIAALSAVVVGRAMIGGPDVSSVQASGAGTVASTPAFPAAADYCYVDAMVPHHEQALLLSEIILEEPAVSDRLRALADFIIVDQEREITAMLAWRDAWVAADRTITVPAAGSGSHAGHGTSTTTVTVDAPTGCDSHADHSAMKGMATPEQLDELRAAEGDAAQRLFLDLMIVHHEGALEMAELVVREGDNLFTRASAKHVMIEQDREITAMRSMLDDLSAGTLE
ncbi:DUF305 domain-containing protein [Agromyces atrinae]|uniref:DUF305 domain-containing protein n=1 Tax=Agromyces atrinae TaxID=592376 RepID=A0A4Q2M6K8_9MICO|nr:DUF305 domain-containing protein [Agromyces atrinae]NYD68020.1 uncharacterized protein (DUF305 family) [Agromyces atrinae]RXZ87825.1 DUF305 domain-containing protein [Agromyces atrinae]